MTTGLRRRRATWPTWSTWSTWSVWTAWSTWLGALLLGALAYVPALASAPGRMPSDTKLYLYLDPGRLIADAPFSWDVRQFAGWVPHQTIAYLWPSGPWFWTFDHLGVPDWVAHRLWIGTILVLGGLGVRWAARQLGLPPLAALAAGIVYQLSPYVLPYVSRTSVMLLPWAAVGWLVGLTVRSCWRTRRRDPALFALVVLTVGAVNATAILLVAPAPVLWLVHAAWRRSITWRTAVVVALKLGGLSLLVSLWWIVMLVVQGRHGADVLSFSETLDAVSLTSTSTETLRSLGYWLFYVRDPYAFTTTASIPYLSSGVVIAAGYLMTALGLAGLALVRWSQRRFAGLLVVAGVVLAVGVHPIDDPSLLMGPLKDSALGLALRSSTRALPLFVLGVALGVGALTAASVDALGRTSARWPALAAPARRVRASILVPAAVVLAVLVLAVAAMPSLRHHQLVDPALERDQDVPRSWLDAVARLDASSAEGRVMQLPGSEFGAFRWGYTVDPPLPGLTTKPLVTRDLLPLGSPGAMDLLYALDNRVQQGTVEPASIAAVARFLGVDTIWVADDLAYDRFRTPHPEVVSAMFGAGVPGLGTPEPFGMPVVAPTRLPMIDEQTLSDPDIGTPLPDVELVPVEDPAPIVRAATDVVVLAGSGDGIVDAAAAGLLDGHEAVLYAADLASGAVDAPAGAVPADALVIVTDANRDRATQWRGSQDVTGFTESGGPDPDLTRQDDADQRLAVFPDADSAAHQTTATLDGGLRVVASSYGEPFAYRPEDRPAMAVDGDPATAWIAGERGDPVGESIRVSTTDGQLVLLQSQDPIADRTITAISVREGDTPARTVELDERSRQAPGQPLPVTAGVPVTLTITAVAPVPPEAGGVDTGPSGVGFAELGPVATEVVHPPADAWPRVTAGAPVVVVLSRERVRATNRWRSDPEPRLVRDLDVPVPQQLAATVTLRLDGRAADALVAAWNRQDGTAVADRRLTGVPGAGGPAAVDGDATTAWTTPFGRALGSSLTIRLGGGAAGPVTLTQPLDDLHSPITSLHARLEPAAGGTAVEADIAVPPADADGRSTLELPVPAGGYAPGDRLVLTITGVDTRLVGERRYGELVALPAAITELDGLPVAAPTPTDPTGCRDDLLSVDGTPVGLQITADDAARLAAGEAVDVGTCDAAPLALTAGTHRLVGTDGATTGVDVDRIVLDARPPAAAAATAAPAAPAEPQVTVERSRTERRATVAPCPDGCWLILGEGYNDGWAASVAGGGSLGAPTQISGGFNGWWLPPSSEARTVTMTWTPQEWLDIALLVAAAGVVACLAVALVDRRRRWSEGAVALVDDVPLLASPVERTSRRGAIAAAAVLVAGALLLVSPAWAITASAVGAVAVALRRTRWLAWVAVVLVTVLGAIVARRETARRFVVDASWPGHFEDLHRAGVFVVVLVLAAVAAQEPGERGGRADDHDRLERRADAVGAVEHDGRDEHADDRQQEDAPPAPVDVSDDADRGERGEHPPTGDAGP